MAKNFKVPAIIFIIIVFSVLFVINQRLSNEIASENKPIQQKGIETLIESVKKIKKDKAITRVHLDPNRQFYVHIFLVDEKEVARYKQWEEKIYDLTGSIPDGKIDFINSNDKTKGYAYYRKNKRHGLYKEFYDNGMVKRETKYSKGKVKTNRENYYDGRLKIEQDFTDAIVGVNLTENGVGKIYYRDGTLMFEYNITNLGRGGYNRSYNVEGELVQEKTFDKYGNLVKIEGRGAENLP